MSIFTFFAAATPTKEWDIDAMLASPAMVQAFHAFCATRCCEEFVEFLQDTRGAYRHRLTTVVETYIQRSNDAFGGKTIVIPQAVRQAVLTTFDMYQSGALGDAFGAMALENTIEAARLDVLRTLDADWTVFKKTAAFAAIAGQGEKKARSFSLNSVSAELRGRAAPLAA